jgi:hypothetical protein
MSLLADAALPFREPPNAVKLPAMLRLPLGSTPISSVLATPAPLVVDRRVLPVESKYQPRACVPGMCISHIADPPLLTCDLPLLKLVRPEKVLAPLMVCDVLRVTNVGVAVVPTRF